MNTPYVKKYDENGVLQNPIRGKYTNHFPSRKERNVEKRKFRFHNNSLSCHLVVNKTDKYRKVIQHEFDKEGKPIRIEHCLIAVNKN